MAQKNRQTAGDTAPLTRQIYTPQPVTLETYQAVQDALQVEAGYDLGRFCEAPVMLERGFADRMIQAGQDILSQALHPAVQQDMARYVPPACTQAGGAGTAPFVAILDFGVSVDEAGDAVPMMIEMQGHPSALAFQVLLSGAYRQAYGIGDDFTCFPAGHKTPESYVADLRRMIAGDYAPEEAVLLELDPWAQGTRMDFYALEELTGIRTVAAESLVRESDRLFYERTEGGLQRIRRLYNRMVPDEFFESPVAQQVPFRLDERLDVDWCSHPEWFFRLSKAAMPYIQHANVPETLFLNGLASLPDDLSGYVLKPLFGRGGRGVVMDVSESDISAIPENQRKDYVLQRKVAYAPVLPMPDGKASKLEIRVMYVWSETGDVTPMMLMGRVMRADMSNARYNEGLSGVGQTAVFIEQP